MDDQIDAFARLSRLHAQGLLTDAEYEHEKTALRAANSPVADTRLSTASVQSLAQRNNWFWIGLSAATILVIGAYFLGKGAKIAEQRGELSASAESKDNGVGELCLLAPFMQLESLNHPVSELAAKAQAAGRNVAWEPTPTGAILRITWDDALEGKSHSMGIELVRTSRAAIQSNCNGAQEGAVANRVIVDGKVLEGLAVGVLMRQIFADDPAEPAASASMDTLPSIASEAPAAPVPAPMGFTALQKRLIKRSSDLEATCRGSYDERAAKAACDARDKAMDDVIAAGICWGKEDQANAEYEYHRCGPGSIGYAQSPQGRGQ